MKTCKGESFQELWFIPLEIRIESPFRSLPQRRRIPEKFFLFSSTKDDCLINLREWAASLVVSIYLIAQQLASLGPHSSQRWFVLRKT